MKWNTRNKPHYPIDDISNMHGVDVRLYVRRFLRDEQGVVFLEFIIVLFVFFFFIFGTIQLCLASLASMYLNYANFMAMRTYSVQYEEADNGYLSPFSGVPILSDDRALDDAGNQVGLVQSYTNAAISALGPIEHDFWKYRKEKGQDLSNNAMQIATWLSDVPFVAISGDGFSEEYLSLWFRLWFKFEASGEDENVFRGQTIYFYPLWVPYANRIISGMQFADNPITSSMIYNPPADRLMLPFYYDNLEGAERAVASGIIAADSTPSALISAMALQQISEQPLFFMRSRNDLREDGMHEAILQRRWKYELEKGDNL